MVAGRMTRDGLAEAVEESGNHVSEAGEVFRGHRRGHCHWDILRVHAFVRSEIGLGCFLRLADAQQYHRSDAGQRDARFDPAVYAGDLSV